jgi:PAS domain S-box-containing protein
VSADKPSRNRRILVVDDNHPIHADFHKVLCPDRGADSGFDALEEAMFGKSNGPLNGVRFEISSAFQGQEGLAMVEAAVAKGQLFAMAFVDVRMPPGWDGIETVARIWKVDPDLQIVICTAYSDYSWEEIIEKIGQSDRMVLLKKPFDNAEVMQLAHALTEKWQLLQDSKQKFEDLETLVAERTGALQAANMLLASEIHEHKLAINRIREQSFLLDLASDAIFVHDLSGKINFWNKGAERLYRWTSAEAVAGDVPKIFVREFPGDDSARQTLMRTGEWNGELLRTTKLNEPVTVTSRWTLLRDAEGAPKSILTIDTDITEKKRLETQYLRTQRMEAIGTLASGMAHDLNNILAPVLIATEVLRWPLPPREFEDTVARIESSVKRGADIIKQVLTFGRGIGGERVLLGTGQIIEEMAKMIHETFPRNIEISFEAPDELWNIQGDRTQIHQVLLNLCVNARDAMAKGGNLSLRAANVTLNGATIDVSADLKPGPYILLQVSDTGAGIPAGIMERIFDPFFTTKGHGKGTGLGLCTASGIVKAHGGAISVSSKVNHGTVFSVYLPAAPGTQSVHWSISATETVVPLGHGETILIVDDEAEIVHGGQKILERYNYQTLTARDGAEGLAVFAHHRKTIKAIVTDVMMPHTDGLAMIRAVRKIDQRLPIIASSGLGTNVWGSDQSSEWASLNIQRFLMKPYTAEHLLVALNELLNGLTVTVEDAPAR